MSRSGYSDDYGTSEINLWRGRVASAIRGRRGQKLLRDLIEGLDAMPEKKLIVGTLQCADGMCALGVAGHARGIDLRPYNPDDRYDDGDERSTEQVAKVLDIASPLAMEITFINDEWGRSDETPETRWRRVRDWAQSRLLSESK